MPLLAREEEEALWFRLDFYLRFQDRRNAINNMALIGITGYVVTLS